MSRCEKKWRREPRNCVAVSASQDDNGQGVCCCVVPVAVLYFYRRNGEWGMGNGARGHVLEVSNVSGEIAGNLPHRVEGEPGTTRPRRTPQPIMLQRDHPASFQKVVLELRLFGRNVSAVTMWFAGVARKSVLVWRRVMHQHFASLPRHPPPHPLSSINNLAAVVDGVRTLGNPETGVAEAAASSARRIQGS